MGEGIGDLCKRAHFCLFIENLCVSCIFVSSRKGEEKGDGEKSNYIICLSKYELLKRRSPCDAGMISEGHTSHSSNNDVGILLYT